MGTDFVTLEHESLFRTTLFRSSDCGKWCRIVSSYERRKKKKNVWDPLPTVLPPVLSNLPYNVRWKGAFTILMPQILSFVLYIYSFILKILVIKKITIKIKNRKNSGCRLYMMSVAIFECCNFNLLSEFHFFFFP